MEESTAKVYLTKTKYKDIEDKLLCEFSKDQVERILVCICETTKFDPNKSTYNAAAKQYIQTYRKRKKQVKST